MTSAATTLLLAGARLASGATVDIQIAGSTIAAVEPTGTPRPPGVPTIDCRERLVSPAFVEGHIHLDKTLLGLPRIPHRAGNSVLERIAAEKALRRDLTLSVVERGGHLIEQVARFGTGAIRSHVDIDTEQRLSGLHALLELKQRYAHLVSLQIVAFPQSGILRDPGTAELLDAALSEGADLVGGLDPAGVDGDVSGHLDIVFGLAERHGVGIDIHLHDAGALGAFELRDIAARTEASGLQGRVVVSHAYALGSADDADVGRTAAALARSRVALMTNGPGTGTMPPVLRLHRAGVTVFAGSDNIRDAWSPYGNGDMLERAAVIGARQGFDRDEDLAHGFAMATHLAADALGLRDYGLAPGAAADLVVLAEANVPEAVVAHGPDRVVIKAGRVTVGAPTAT